MVLMATLTSRRRSTDCFGGVPTSSKPAAAAAARGRKSRSHHAETPPPTTKPGKRVMENAVSLKRAERTAPKSTENPAAQAPEKKKAGDYPVAAGQCEGQSSTTAAAAAAASGSGADIHSSVPAVHN